VDPAYYGRPDLRLTNSTRTIGLELTYLADQEQTETDAIAAKLEERLHEKRLARIGDNPTSVLGKITLFGVPYEHGKREGYWPPSRDHDAFCDDLLDLVEQTATGAAQHISIDPASHPTIAILQGLEVTPAPKVGHLLRWDIWPKTRFVGTSQKLLDACIRKKKTLASTYHRTGIDGLWLAIIPGPWEVALPTEFQANLDRATGKDANPFERIVIADLGQPDCIVASIP